MKLKEENSIQVSQMKDGQIGVITGWGDSNKRYLGKIIQRYKECLIPLQQNSDHAWYYIPNDNNCQVRILQKGETLIIE